MTRAAALWLLCFAVPGRAAQWNIQFFHDEDKSSASFRDIKACSDKRVFAVGLLFEDGRAKGIAAVSSDGGAQWSYVPLKESPRSAFCLNETAAWMVTDRGVWFSDEAGRSWRKVLKDRRIARVHFLSRERGFAIGAEKTILETDDGGKTWKPVAAVETLNASDNTTFEAIGFAKNAGIIAGSARRLRLDRLPPWMDPEASRFERPALSVFLQTRDGGATWKANTSSLFGSIRRISLSPDGRGLALVQYHGAFDWPSELIRIDTATGRNERAFREKNRAVTDILIRPGGPAYAAGFEPPGEVAYTPVPGKLKILRSLDLKQWEEMEVDYRALAGRAILAASASGPLWVATDTGMILKHSD